MDLGRILEALVERRRLLAWIMLAIMALLVILDLFNTYRYDRFWWEGVGGFGAIWGFLSCVVIIVVSKALGYAFLYQREDYYDE